MAGSPAGQQPAAICTLKSPIDAVHILEGVRAGLIPRVARRLTGFERQSIQPGTVWVWEEGETKMKRWTDGKKWGASRVGNGGFLLYTEMNDPSESNNNYMTPYHNHQMRRPTDSLLKQTYSTTSYEDGQVKYWHVVAYTNKFNPGYDGPNPLPLPHQLPLLANISIEPGRYPDWEQQRDTTEAYARRPPPGTILPSQGPTTATAPTPIDPSLQNTTPGISSRVPSPPGTSGGMYTPGAMPYASPPYGSRRSRDARDQPMWPYQPMNYGPEDYAHPYDPRANGQGPSPYFPYDVSPIQPNGNGSGHGHVHPTELYHDMSRRDRPPSPRSMYGSAYALAPGSGPGYPAYPRIDRYQDHPPDYSAASGGGRPPQIQIRTHEADIKPTSLDNDTLHPQSQDKNQLSVARLPPTPNSTTSNNPDLPSLGPSPKLSINNNLLNPPDGSGNGGGGGRDTLTLPPLSRNVHDRASPVSPTGRVSPNGDSLQSEDARQLDGLGRKVY